MSAVNIQIPQGEIQAKSTRSAAQSSANSGGQTESKSSEQGSFSSELKKEVSRSSEAKDARKTTENHGDTENSESSESVGAPVAEAAEQTAESAESTQAAIVLAAAAQEQGDAETPVENVTEIVTVDGKVLPEKAQGVADQVLPVIQQVKASEGADETGLHVGAALKQVLQERQESVKPEHPAFKADTTAVQQPTASSSTPLPTTVNALQAAEGDDQAAVFNQILNASSQSSATQANANVDVQQIGTVNTLDAGQQTRVSNTQITHQAAPIQVPLGNEKWGEEVGQRVTWMVNNQIQSAEVKMNPPQLGPIEIRVTVQHDQANVSMSAAHGVTKDALEQAIPRLREMLGDQGLNLANVDVSEHSFSEQQQQAQEEQEAAEYDLPEEEMVISLDSLSPTGQQVSIGAIDYFA